MDKITWQDDHFVHIIGDIPPCFSRSIMVNIGVESKTKENPS
jgi:hypothetical protein